MGDTEVVGLGDTESGDGGSRIAEEMAAAAAQFSAVCSSFLPAAAEPEVDRPRPQPFT